MTFQYEIEIDKPVSEVYAAFYNPDNLPRWLIGLQRIEPISGTPGQVGSKSRQIYLERGRIVELIETITEHEPEKSFGGNIEGQGVNCSLHFEFVDRGSRTLVRATSNLHSKSLIMRLMWPLIRGGIRKRQNGSIQRFKELLEAGELATP